MFSIIYGTWFRCSTGVQIHCSFESGIWVPQLCLLFLHSQGWIKFDDHMCTYIQTHMRACAHTHISLSLHVYIKVLLPLQHFSLFSDLPILQNNKCLKRKYFWLGYIRNFMCLHSVCNVSLRNRYIFPVIWHSRCPILQFFWSTIYMDASVFWSLNVEGCFDLSCEWQLIEYCC